MGYANINTLLFSSLRLKATYLFPKDLRFNKWCGTKVAHCTYVYRADDHLGLLNILSIKDAHFTLIRPMLSKNAWYMTDG